MHRYSIIPVLVLLVGCAGVHVTPGDSGKGIRYYRSKPYLLVYTDNNAGLKTELTYLPDTTRVFAAYPYNILASSETSFEFEGGVLRTGEATIDTGVVPRAVLAAVEKVATASIAAALREGADAKPNIVPAPVLYRIEWDGKTAYLVGPEGRVCAGTTTDIFVKGKVELQPCNPPGPLPACKPLPCTPPAAGGAQ
jgi:hypothetical protein